MRWKAVAIIGVAFILASAAAVGGADYIGAAKCKMCHKVEHTSWAETRHAKAFENLKGDEQSNPECLKCHATAGKADLPGVQCEACHGAGSEFKSMKIMKVRDDAVAAGLIIANAETCKSCHANAPHEVSAFDYEAMKGTGIHAHKEKKAE